MLTTCVSNAGALFRADPVQFRCTDVSSFRGMPPLNHDMRVIHRDGSFMVRKGWSVEFDENASELCPHVVTGWHVDPYPLPLGPPVRATYTLRADQPRARLDLQYRDPTLLDPLRERQRSFSLIRVEHLESVDSVTAKV